MTILYASKNSDTIEMLRVLATYSYSINNILCYDFTFTCVRTYVVLMVEFASGQFTGSELSGFIEVIVRVTGGVSSSPITVTVTPSEQSPVSAMGMR